MKKVALVFVLAVFVPSLVLAWLAMRSVRDQQFLLERQQSLLYQGVADGIAKSVQDALSDYQRDFAGKVAGLVHDHNPAEAAKTFDGQLRKDWPLAQVGFAVTLTGEIVSPSPYDRPETRLFCADNSRFLGNRETVEVYWNPKQVVQNSGFNGLNANNASSSLLNTSPSNNLYVNNSSANNSPFNGSQTPQADSWSEVGKRYGLTKSQTRNVIPQQQQLLPVQRPGAQDDNSPQQQLSKNFSSEAEFRQLIADDTQGALARFVDNKLNVLFWCRPSPPAPQAAGKGAAASPQSPAEPQFIFGAQLSLMRLEEALRPLVQNVEPALRDEICLALLDDTAKPVALSHSEFHANWKRPFVATEIGEILPHWEIAVYLLDPAKLTRSAHTLKLTLGLLIATLVLAIGVGSWLIITDLNRQLTLARQKTDFVSNVSHELKTPLTSIRMFSELLAEGRIPDAAKQRSYLAIITAEAARLTRLINNVLDFARIERGEKKYQFQQCDLAALLRETAETYRPHLETNGFRFDCEFPEVPVLVQGDRDALAQVVVNLLSNAEKYSDNRKEIKLQVRLQTAPLPHVEVRVLDRGLGVPRGSEQKIFEKFYRAHDSLSSGIQGSGLGLTLARQIARAHGGDVSYEARSGGGSCFSLRLPVLPGSDENSRTEPRLPPTTR
jgi:signal transduction histidine kinase